MPLRSRLQPRRQAPPKPRRKPRPHHAPAPTEATALPEKIAASGTYRVNAGDTLTKIARSLNAKNRAEIDMTMIALFRDNPRAFDGNINILRRGAILRVPGADEIAALNQKEAISEVNKQMSAWRSRAGALADGSHLRLVTPKANGGTLGTGTSPSSEAVGAQPPATAASNSEAQALKDRESKAAQQRLIDIHNAELKALQEKAAQPRAAAAGGHAATGGPAARGDAAAQDGCTAHDDRGVCRAAADPAARNHYAEKADCGEAGAGQLGLLARCDHR